MGATPGPGSGPNNAPAAVSGAAANPQRPGRPKDAPPLDDGTEVRLHRGCETPFIDRRMGEEGLA
jgi:hypothetical protein